MGVERPGRSMDLAHAPLEVRTRTLRGHCAG